MVPAVANAISTATHSRRPFLAVPSCSAVNRRDTAILPDFAYVDQQGESITLEDPRRLLPAPSVALRNQPFVVFVILITGIAGFFERGGLNFGDVQEFESDARVTGGFPPHYGVARYQ